MTSKLAIINRSLAFLGERPITNPDAPDTPAARHLCDNIDSSRQEVLRRYAWNFAEKWANTTLTTAPTVGPYDNAYDYPADCMRLIWVGEMDSTRTDYRLVNTGTQRVIAINNDGDSTLPLAYTCDVTNYSLWDPLARKVLALWMAVDAAKAITGKGEHVKILNELLSEELKDAVGVDGQEQQMMRHVTSGVQDERDYAQYGSDSWTRVEGY